jgi:hypothetical protein
MNGNGRWERGALAGILVFTVAGGWADMSLQWRGSSPIERRAIRCKIYLIFLWHSQFLFTP